MKTDKAVESPVMVFDTRRDDYMGLLEAFGNCTALNRAQVLDLLYAPPLEEIMASDPRRPERHLRLEQQRQAYLYRHPVHQELLTVPVTQKLLAIIETFLITF